MYLLFCGSQTTIWLLDSKPVKHLVRKTFEREGTTARTLEAQILDLEALVAAVAARYDRGIRKKGVVNSRKRHKVCLKLIQVDIQSAIETQTGGNRANDLGDKTVEMVISRARDVELALTDIVHSFVVNEKRAIGVLNSGMCGEDGIVGFHHCSCHAGGRVNHKFELGLLAILGRKMLEQECTETRPCSAAKGVEDQKALKRGAII